VHESDFIEVNCTVEYKGSWMPNVSCIPDAPVELVDEHVETTPSFRRLSYIRVIAAANIADRALISCETTFFRPQSERPPSDHTKVLKDTPRYHHNWQSSPIRVFNTTIHVFNSTGIIRHTQLSRTSFSHSDLRDRISRSLHGLIQNSK